MDDLNTIIINKKRTRNVKKKYENIVYQTHTHGNVRPKLEDKDNHTIDATRYGLESEMKSKSYKEPINIRI